MYQPNDNTHHSFKDAFTAAGLMRRALDAILDRWLRKNNDNPSRCNVGCAKELAETQNFDALLILVTEALEARAAIIGRAAPVDPAASAAGYNMRTQPVRNPPRTKARLGTPTAQQKQAALKAARERIFFSVIPDIDVREMTIAAVLSFADAGSFFAKLREVVGNATDKPRLVKDAISDKELRKLITEWRETK